MIKSSISKLFPIKILRIIKNIFYFYTISLIHIQLQLTANFDNKSMNTYSFQNGFFNFTRRNLSRPAYVISYYIENATCLAQIKNERYFFLYIISEKQDMSNFSNDSLLSHISQKARRDFVRRQCASFWSPNFVPSRKKHTVRREIHGRIHSRHDVLDRKLFSNGFERKSGSYNLFLVDETILSTVLQKNRINLGVMFIYIVRHVTD